MKLKLIIISCLLSVLPLMFFQIYYYYSTEKILIHNRINTRNLEIRNAIEELNEKVATAKQHLDLMAQLSLPQVSLEYNRPESLREFLKKTMSDSLFMKLVVLNANKNVFVEIGTPSLDEILVNDADVKVIRSNGILLIKLSSKIYSEGVHVGYFVGVIKAGFFKEIVTKLTKRLNLSNDELFFFYGADKVRECSLSKETSIPGLKLCAPPVQTEISFFQKNFLFILIVLCLSALMYAILYNALFSQIFKPLRDLLESFYVQDHNKKSRSFKKYKNFRELSALEELRDDVFQRIQKYQSIELERTKSDAIAKVATQAVHDIRSPLLALQELKDDILILPDSVKNQIRQSIIRIEEITYNLLRLHRNEKSVTEKNEVTHMLPCLRAILLEKQFEYRKFEKISIVDSSPADSYPLFARFNSAIFKRILSNLINNAFESLDGQHGIIRLNVSQENLKIRVDISDTGKGIPVAISTQIFKENFTTKDDGNGIGLSMAKREIESKGGEIFFISEPNLGTTFSIHLPISPAPEYFIDSLRLDNFRNIIILDDDPAFLEVWYKKLREVNIEIHQYSTVESLLSDFSYLDDETLLLSDYDLMDDKYNGIDIIKKFNNVKNSVLVTALSEDSNLVKECLKLDIKLLPKTLVPEIPIYNFSVDFLKELVLIDDDRVLHAGWFNFAKKNNVTFHCFTSVDEFLVMSDSINKDSIILLDSYLKEGERGEERAVELAEFGFKNIYLMSGYDFEGQIKNQNIKGFLVKDFQISSKLVLQLLLK